MKQFLHKMYLGLFGEAKVSRVNWMSFDQAVAAQKSRPKLIFMDVYTIWSPSCKLLDENTFENAKITQFINANYYAVKFDAEGTESLSFAGKKFDNVSGSSAKGVNSMHDFANYLKIQAYPAMFILDENFKFSKEIVGYRTAEQLLHELILSLQ